MNSLKTRPIAFRAWSKNSKEMISWEELEEDDDLLHRALHPKIFNGLVPMQFTGLLDKNGKEIYSNDYLGDWCVFWGSGKYILQNILTGDIIDCDEINTIGKEITGNTFETPREHKAVQGDL